MLGPREIVALLREAQAGAPGTEPIVVSGPGASEVARAIRAGGAGELVVVDGDPARAVALVRVIEGSAAGAADVEQLRRGARAAIPVIALVRDGAERVPYVLALDVVTWAREAPVPLDALGARLTRGLGPREADALAARLPALRPSVVGRHAQDTALVAAATALLRRGRGPVSPALTLMQARLLRRMETANGVRPPGDPQSVLTSAGPEIAAALATGVACRRLVRGLPVRSRLIDAAVAYGGTLALATVADKLLRRR
jgi:hypothetical protein